MIGAIAGDIIGFMYEGRSPHTRNFPLFLHGSRFTDDTVMTLAVAESLVEGTPFEMNMRSFYRRYPKAGYGGFFIQWLASEMLAYGSYGNGAIMRVSGAGYQDTAENVERIAKKQAEVSHNHPNAVEAAKVIALAIFHARNKTPFKNLVEERMGVKFDAPPAVTAGFDITARGTCINALSILFQSSSYEDAVRSAVFLGGDTDTLACVVGSIAEHMWGIPEDIAREARSRLDPFLLDVLEKFEAKYVNR